MQTPIVSLTDSALAAKPELLLGESDRYDPLSAFNGLWGVAFLGLFLANLQKFGLMPGQVDQLVRGPHGGNYWLLILNRVLLSNTLPALAALLFGVGILWFLSKPNSAVGNGNLCVEPPRSNP